MTGRSVALVRTGEDHDGDHVLPDVAGWCDEARAAAREPCPAWRVAALCRRLAGLAASDAQAHQFALRAQRTLLSADAGAVRIIRVPPDTAEQAAVAVARALGHGCVTPAERDVPLFHPPLQVVIPPRPARPDETSSRQQQAIWSGHVKNGNTWSTLLRERLHEHLGLSDWDEVHVTKSGTDALRLAIAGTVGAARPGDLAVLPSFTFRATADVLVQLGYGLRFADVDPWSWTLDATSVEQALTDPRVRVVVCVDSLGNPCDYEALNRVCAVRGVPLIADSAPAIGSLYRGRPVGSQAAAHAFSMSFAKVLTAAGAGGAVVYRSGAGSPPVEWLGSSLMDEVHAIAALDQLDVLPELVKRRGEVAGRLQAVADRIGFPTQQVAAGNRHCYVHWVARVPERDALAARLARLGVLTKPYYNAQHLHHERAVAGVHLPVTEGLDREALALPMSSELSDRQADRLAAALERAALSSAARPVLSGQA